VTSYYQALRSPRVKTPGARLLTTVRGKPTAWISIDVSSVKTFNQRTDYTVATSCMCSSVRSLGAVDWVKFRLEVLHSILVEKQRHALDVVNMGTMEQYNKHFKAVLDIHLKCTSNNVALVWWPTTVHHATVFPISLHRWTHVHSTHSEQSIFEFRFDSFSEMLLYGHDFRKHKAL
jgi:hypothetical protein